jgi:hypothetical protein
MIDLKEKENSSSKEAQHKVQTLESVLSAKHRVENGRESEQLTILFILWFFSSIAITIATGVQLWYTDSTT